MTADPAKNDAERLAELRRDWSDSDEIVAFLFDQLDARDARIAEQAAQYDAILTSWAECKEQRDRLSAALSDQRVLAADAQRGNAATIGELRTALAQAEAEVARLRVIKADFAALSPTTPLPWNTHPRKRWLIVDANGDEVCNTDGSADDCVNIVGMILVAVNTCGGFRAAPASPERAR